MTPEDRTRLRELPKLIAAENNLEKMKILAAELQSLLDKEASEQDLSRRYA